MLAKDIQRFKSIVAPHLGQGRSSAAEDDSSFAFIETHILTLFLTNVYSVHTLLIVVMRFSVDTNFAPEK